MGNTERALRSQLTQLTLGYWRSQVLFTANELGVFPALREGGLDARQIAERVGSAPEQTERLLDACAAVGLLGKDDGRYSNSELADRFLVDGSPSFMGNWVRFMGDCYRPWGQLIDAVRGGKPVEDGLAQLGRGDDYARFLILAMHDYAMGPGRAAVERLDLTGRRRLLDVGGGPGSYSIMLAERHPQLEAVVFDLPPVLEITSQLVADHGLEGRVSLQPGNYLDDDLGSGFDVVLLSNVLHQEDPNTCRAILEKARRALVPGGMVVVQLSFLNSSKDGPPWAVLQSLQLALLYQGGRAYTVDEMLELVSAAGFSSPRLLEVSLLSSESLIIATTDEGGPESGESQ